jgi:NAD(P)-dependent dehydrogenase (short-subunit alcohol dehydrogenase family)
MSTGIMAGTAILITGASRGIGAATARVAHREGAVVIAHYGANKAAAQRLADDLGGERIHLISGDLTDSASTRRVWEQAVEAAGGIGVLVNNAGAWIESPLTDDGWADGWRDNLALNLQAPADLCRYAIEHFRAHGGGTIVNVASRSSHRGDDAEHLAYGAAKGGLLALTRGIARGYARESVLAYAVAPGWVATDLSADAVDADAIAALPMREPVPPQDVAETIVFLASGRARHATGATVDITGADYVR